MRWIVHLEGGPRRVNHAAVAVGDKIYSFGGYCTGEDYKIQRPMDVHILDSVSLRWIALSIPESGSQQYFSAPFQRYGHTAVPYGELIYIWGGRNDISACNQLFCFNTVTLQWSKPKTQGQAPGARDGHSSCVINSKMYIFGGYEEELDQFSQDVYVLDFKTMIWHHIKAKGRPPRRRDFHSATAIGQYMYIFGGRGGRIGLFYSQDDEIYCNQIMCFDTINQTWNELKTTGPRPLGRRSHSAFLYNGDLYIFGGYNGIYNLHFADLFRFDPVSCQWSIVKPCGQGPCTRRRQCCCVIGHKVFLFGGTSPYPSGTQPPTVLPHTEGTDATLMDHSDLHILDFSPSLKVLCELVVVEYGLDKNYLPADIRWELAAMTTNNNISRPLNNSG